MNKRIHLLLACVGVFFLAILSGVLKSGGPLNLLDDGWKFEIAKRLADGEVLYRDIISYYPPGIHYLYMLIFELFSASLNAVYEVNLVFTGFFAMSYFILGIRILRSIPWSLVAVSCLIFFGGSRNFLEPLDISLFFSCLSFLVFPDLERSPKASSFFLPALFTALAVFFKHEVGVVLASTFCVCSFLWLVRSGFSINALRSLGRLFWYVLWALIALISIFVLVRSSIDLHQMIVALFPRSQAMMSYFALPFPELHLQSLSWQDLISLIHRIEFFVPFALGICFWLMFFLERKNLEGESPRLLLFVLCFSTFHLPYLMGRADFSKLLGVTQFAFIMGLSGRLVFQSSKAKVLGFVTLSCLMILIGSRVIWAIQGESRLTWIRFVSQQRLELSRAQYKMDSVQAAKIFRICSEIGRITQEKDRIAVFPASPMFYFLCERGNFSKFSGIFRGVFLDTTEYQEFYNSIRLQVPKIILYNGTAEEEVWNLKAAFPEVMNALNTGYRLNSTVEDFEIWVPKGKE